MGAVFVAQPLVLAQTPVSIAEAMDWPGISWTASPEFSPISAAWLTELNGSGGVILQLPPNPAPSYSLSTPVAQTGVASVDVFSVSQPEGGEEWVYKTASSAESVGERGFRKPSKGMIQSQFHDDRRAVAV